MKKRLLSLSLLLLIVISFLIEFSIITKAETNPTLPGIVGRETNGSSYWATSNLREWLNSDADAGKVKYTSNAPTADRLGSLYAYDKEAGFLNGFTTEEKNAIAVTERRVPVHSSIDSGASLGGNSLPNPNVYGPTFLSNYPKLANDYKSYSYQKLNDKVFLLTYYEIYHYLNKRNFTYKKRVTSQVKSKYNLSSDYINWWIQGCSTWSGWDYEYYASYKDNMIRQTRPNDKNGIVPAINIKPSYTFADGRKASSLKIGDTVTFGTYLGAKIDWQVVNISDDGYPFLLSSNIIDFKVYDTPGDQSKKNSEVINFPKADVSLLNDVQYKTTTGSSDTNVASVKVLNPEELELRQNGSFTLNFEVTDESGIDYIILPDGNKASSNKFSYTFTSNGNYILKIMDKAGNYLEFCIPVGNINAEPEVFITPSTTAWTNQNVNVDIKASNDVKWSFSNYVMPSTTEYGSAVFPNYISYASKQFKIKGSVTLQHIDKDYLNTDLLIGFSYFSRGLNTSSYVLGGNWQGLVKISCLDIYNSPNHTLDFEYIVTIPSNYVQNLKVWIKHNVNHALGNHATFLFNNLSYELLDTDDFAIKSLSLPNGSVVEGKTSYVDTISAEGSNTYSYSVLDNRGKTTKKSITTKIDKTNPTVNINYDKSVAKQVTINISASDLLSGVSKIKLPNGNYITGSTASYVVKSNGSYTFECTDVAGNVTRKTVTIDNIDLTAPTINISKSISTWTNDTIELTVTAKDTQSGIAKIQLPDGNYVNSSSAKYVVKDNGTFTFKATDGVGNVGSNSITISNIDKTSPSVNHNTIYNSDNTKATVTISATDNQSGVYSIKDFNGKISLGNSITFETTENGLFLFEVTDNANNKTIYSVSVNNIKDKELSEISKIEYKLSGATSKDWTTYNEAFYITNEGVTTITARSYDKAGNVSDEKTSIVKIDKTKPVNGSVKIELK